MKEQDRQSRGIKASSPKRRSASIALPKKGKVMRVFKTQSLPAVLLLVALSGLLWADSLAATYTVQELRDHFGSDPTLRYIIYLCNTNPGPDDIEFDVSGTIDLITSLPPLTDDGTRILGQTAPDAGPGPDIHIACNGHEGITIQADDCEVHGIEITDFVHGVWLCAGAERNVIGRSGAGRRNVIHEGGIGIQLSGPGCDDNVIQCNAIRDNTGSGINIEEGARGNLIGGDQPNDGNCVSGNAQHGIYMFGDMVTVEENQIEGNKIGTQSDGLVADPNDLDGLHLAGLLCMNNEIVDNLISGNGSNGVAINEAIGNNLQGNYIGVNVDATGPLGNQSNGVLIELADDNRLQSNVISANRGHGVRITGAGSDSNHLEENVIGLDGSAGSALGNQLHGVLLDGGTKNSVLESNVVSANGQNGITIDGENTDLHELKYNNVGTDCTGMVILGNEGSGIVLRGGSQDCSIGPDNCVGGHDVGIHIRDATTSGHQIFDNLVGFDRHHMGIVPNIYGIQVDEGVTDNVIGPDNILSGNIAFGIRIDGSRNIIIANRIGTNDAGNMDVGNSGGMLLAGNHNLVGGAPPDGNLISANIQYGITVANADGNSILGNTIGASGTGTPLPNTYGGIWLCESARGTRIGSDQLAHMNTIAYNGGHGVLVGSWTDPATTEQNRIGRNSIYGNSGDGIRFSDGTTQNRVERATIYENAERGICVADTSKLNVFRENSITLNGMEMIRQLDYGNELIPGPTITAASATAALGTTNLGGSEDSVEVFYDDDDEGRVYLGTCYVPSGTDAWSVTFSSPIPSGVYLTATNTGDWESGWQTSGPSASYYYVLVPEDVPGEEEIPPEAFSLALAGLNPCRGSAKLRFAAPKDAHLSLRVYDVGGRLVNILADEIFAAGTHEIRWDGCDSTGRPASAGVYLMAARYNGEVRLQRVTLLRE